MVRLPVRAPLRPNSRSSLLMVFTVMLAAHTKAIISVVLLKDGTLGGRKCLSRWFLL
ncbi:hypothetical protein BDW72DRAFT_180863 [Aspergillus terricola var. indicus]